jgi:hypothetical protein
VVSCIWINRHIDLALCAVVHSRSSTVPSKSVPTNSKARCSRFASLSWTLTWAEEDSVRSGVHFQLDISGHPLRSGLQRSSQVSPTEGRTWGTSTSTRISGAAG